MLQWHIQATIWNTTTGNFEEKSFSVCADSSEEAEQKAFDILSQDGIPLHAVCSLVASVN